MADSEAPSHWPMTLINGAASLLNILLPLGLVRLLSPDQLGRYKVFSLYVVLGPALSLSGGFMNGLYHWMGDYPASKPELRQSWTFCLGLVLSCSAAGLLSAGPLARAVGVSAADIRVFMLAMPFSVASAFFEDLLVARGDIWAGSWYSAGFGLLRTGAMLAAAWRWRSVEPVLRAFAGAAGLRALAGWALLRRSGEVTPLFSREKAARVLGYAAPVSLSAFAGLGLSNVDQMILSFRLSASEFAFYSTGCLSVPPLEILETSVNRVLIPRMSRAFAAKDHAGAASLFSDAVSELWRYLLPATVGMVLFADPIVRLLFTERYAPAVPVLRLFAFSYLIAAVPFNSVARARGDGAWILRTTLLFAPLSLASTLGAAVRWGAAGALAAMLGTALLTRVYALRYGGRCLGLPCSRLLPGRRLLLQTGAALGAAGLALSLRPVARDARAWFLLAGPVFTAAYFAAEHALSGRHALPRAPGSGGEAVSLG